MRRFWTILAFCAGLGAGVAQADALRSLVTGDDGKGWEAVGRLNIGKHSFCTGALIAPNQVLTAAHCLYDKDTGETVAIEGIEFLAGWRNGRAQAYRGVRRGIVHPNYHFDDSNKLKRVAFDLAVLELDRPIRLPGIQPFDTARNPRKGDEVGVVSYAHDRSEAPSLQEVCHVLARQPGVLLLSCDVDFGSSGAPIFTFDHGVARIVSVVSSKSDMDDQKVSLGVGLGRSLEVLKMRLETGQGVLTRQRDPAKGFGQGTARGTGGAKFVRP